MFLVSGFESAVFCVGERTPTFAPRFLKERGAVGEGGTDFAGEMGAGVWIVALVCVGEVGAEPAREYSVRLCTVILKMKTCLSLRSTAERS